MIFDYAKIWETIMSLWNWIKEIFNIGSDSAEKAYSNFMLGLKNRIGDQVIGSGYIHKGDQLSVMHQGVDPRDLEHYLELLDQLDSFEHKEEQILDWYYTQEIDIMLKDALLLIISRIPEYINYEMTFIPEVGEEKPGQLNSSIKVLTEVVSKNKFEALPNIIDLELIKIKTEEYKAAFLIEAAKIYIEINQFKKGLNYLEQAYEIKPQFDILKHVVQLYQQVNDWDKVINLLVPFQNDTNPNDRIYALLRLGIAYNNKGMIKESELVLIQALEVYHTLDNQDTRKRDQLVLIHKFLSYSSLKKGDIELTKERVQSAVFDITGKRVKSLMEIIELPEMESMYLLIGVLYGIQNEWGEAEKCFHKRLEVLDFKDDHEELIQTFITTFTNLGVVALYKKEYKLLEEYIDKLYSAIDRFGIDTSVSAVFLLLLKSSYNLMQENAPQAYIYLNRIFDILNKHPQNNGYLRAFSYSHLGNLFAIRKEFDKSTFYYDKTKVVMDELLGEGNMVSMTIEEKVRNIMLSDFQIIIIV